MTVAAARRRRLGPEPAPAVDPQDQDADPAQVARTIVLRKLSASARTRAQLADDLQSRGVPDDIAQSVLDRFEDVGLIDDEQFTQQWIDSRRRTRGTARTLLRRELRDKGVDDAVIDDALGQIDVDDERAQAVRLVETKLASTRRLEPQARVRRLAGLLVRRGYSSGVAFSVVRDVLGAEATSLDCDGLTADA